MVSVLTFALLLDVASINACWDLVFNHMDEFLT